MNWQTLTSFARRLLGWMCLALACTPSHAGSDPIRIVVAGIEKQIYLPAALADRLGYFREQGLDVQLLSDTSGVNAEDELLTGAVQGVVGFYDHTIDLQAKGKFVQSVVQFSHAPGEAEIVSARVSDVVRGPADFRGRTLGVTGLGSSTHLLSQYLAVTQGVKPADVNFIAVGSGAGFVAAMRQGRIDAGMTTEPTVSGLLQSGDARLLVDLRTPQAAETVLGGVYPGACLYVTTRWANAHRAEVQRLVNALVKALRFIDSHSAVEIEGQIPADFSRGDPALYIAALRDGKSMFIRDGAMPPSGPATVLRVMKVVNRSLRTKPIDLNRTYTTEFTSAVPR